MRLAAAHRDAEWFHNIQARTGIRPTELARLTRAWRNGGPAGVTAAEKPFTPEPATMAAARTALTRALQDVDDSKAQPRLRAWRNRLTLEGAGLQLRLGPDMRWHPYEREDSEWWPCAAADPDPVAALAAAWEKRRESAGS